MKTAQNYLTPQTHTFWKWDLEERSVHWLNGTTIAFPQELVAVLEGISPHGYPRFDCILLVLAALRDSWSPFNTKLEYDQLQLSCFKYANLSDLEALELIHQLDRLNALPRDLRQSLQIKTVLCDMVLEDAERRCVGEDMERVLSGLKERREDVPSQESLSFFSVQLDLWRVDLLALKAGLERIDEQRLRRRLATGIDEPVQPTQDLAGEEFSDAIEARELMETLLQDWESYSLGKLAKNLLAALYRPARLVPEMSLQLEGYSDIANRGTVDRLLISELAHDNDTLAVRIANGEALYMRREVPPSRESVDRCILIDCGIRSWGTPRVYNAAIALALTAGAPAKSRVLAWRAMESELKRSYFIDQSGLSEHMGAFDAGLHPGPVLSAFYEELSALQANVEVYLILSRDSWNDLGFRTALHTSKITSLTAAVVDRFGDLELIAYSRSGLQLIKCVTLKLEELQRESQAAPAALLVNETLPSIFRCNPFPLRLSMPNSNYYLVDNGLILGTADGNRLVLWDNPDQGGVTLHSQLRNGQIAWAGRDRDRRTLFVVWANRTHASQTVMRFDLRNYAMLEKSELALQSDSLQFSVDGSTLIVCDSKQQQIQAWDIANGEMIDALTVKQTGLCNSFQDRSGNWFAAHFNGLGFDVLPVSFPRLRSSSEIIFLMAAPHRDGFIAVTTSGRMLHSNGSDTKIQPAKREDILAECVTAMGDNRWIVFGTATGSFVVEVNDDGTAGNCTPFSAENPRQTIQTLAWGVAQNRPWIIQKNFRNRFHRIALYNGCLVLLRNQRAFILQNVNKTLNWVASPLVFSEPLRKEAYFQCDNKLEKEVGFRLEFARQNQMEAVLDSRGLLHLRSLNSLHTELTLTINDGLASGWTSDGRWFGSAYHCSPNAVSSSNEIDTDVLQPLLEQFSGGVH